MKLSYNFRVRTPTELFFPNITMYGYVHILTFSYIKTVKERTHINIFTLYYVQLNVQQVVQSTCCTVHTKC